MCRSHLRFALLCVFAGLIMTACRGVNDDESDGSTGELTLGITDGPLDDADEVRIAFSGIEITPVGGTSILIEDLREDFVYLLDLEGGERELVLDEYDLPDGSYDTLRLIIDEAASYVEVDGAQYELTIPATEIANLTFDINVFFDPDNDNEDLTVDFDLRKSLRVDNSVSPPVYQLFPRLRVVETERTETLRGTVDETLITNSGCSNLNFNQDGNAVYLYIGNSGALQDIQNNSGDPYATTTVRNNNVSDEWEFVFGFLPRQTYRAAFTCDASIDDPDTDDTAIIDYEGPINVDVQQNHSEEIEFEP